MVFKKYSDSTEKDSLPELPEGQFHRCSPKEVTRPEITSPHEFVCVSLRFLVFFPYFVFSRGAMLAKKLAAMGWVRQDI